MVTTRKAIATYLAINVLFFAFGYHALGIRELGLYFFTLAVGAPASLAVLPLSEATAEYVGWSLGSPAHVWTCNVVAALLNCALALVVVAGIRRLHKLRAAAGQPNSP